LQVKGKDDKRQAHSIDVGDKTVKLHERVRLSNGLTLEIWDYSRPIAADTTKVELVAQIEVEFRPEFFQQRERHEKLVRTLGPKGVYEYRKARTFVNNNEREKVFDDLLKNFRENTLPYLEKADFPRKFAKSKLREIEEHWYRYLPREEEG